MRLRVLTWNLFHGRAVPPAGRALLGEFATTLAGWEWDVALLQECPRWWPGALAAVAGADHRSAPTSRNQLAPLRRALAVRAPDLVRSGGGGCNAILVRRPAIAAHAVRRLRLWPERRVMHAVRLADGTWVANLHAQAHSAERAHADHAVAREALDRWTALDPGLERGAPTPSGEHSPVDPGREPAPRAGRGHPPLHPGRGRAPLVVGGDLNLRRVHWPGFLHAGASDVDHIFARGLSVVAPGAVLERGRLSDHAPLRAVVGR